MRLVEKHPVADVFVSGLGRVDILNGGFARFTFFVERIDDEGMPEYVVVQKAIAPIEAVQPAIKLTIDTLAGRIASTVRRAFAALH